MPFLLNGLKMSDTAGIKPSRTLLAAPRRTSSACWSRRWWCCACRIITAGRPGTVGVSAATPALGLNEVQKTVENLTIKHQLDGSVDMTAWQRVLPAFLGGQADPDSHFLWGAGVGFVLVITSSLLRLRFTWWPLHPVLFLVWGTFPAMAFAQSLLLGWIIKTIVTKFGGGKKYHELKPLMIGVIAGDLLGGLVFMVFNFYYYTQTGHGPRVPYQIFPG